MAVNQIYRLAVQSTVNFADDIVNVFHYRQVLSMIGNPAEELANQWVTDVLPSYRNVIPAAIAIQTVQVRPIPPATEFFDLTLPTTLGTLAGETLPLTSAPIITWKSDFIGRSKRGRSYMPPITESHQDTGVLGAGIKTLLNTFAVAAKLLPPGGSEQWQLVIYSRTLDSAVDVTAHIVRDFLATMRSRKQGVGG